MSHQPAVIVTETESSSAVLPRVLGALLLLVVAVIHYLDLGGKLSETPYLGYLYIALMVGSVLAAGLLFYRPRAGWTLGGLLALGAFVAYCLSRTTGLPNATDDIGNWGEPLGVTSLIVEGVMVVLSATMLGRRTSG